MSEQLADPDLTYLDSTIARKRDLTPFRNYLAFEKRIYVRITFHRAL